MAIKPIEDLSYRTDAIDTFRAHKYTPLPTWKVIPKAIQGYKVFYSLVLSRSLDIFICNDDYMLGCLKFDYRTGSRVAKSYGLPKSKYATPHISLAPELRGKGIATQLYLMTLSSGVSLVTFDHSRKASKLWNRIGKLVGISDVLVFNGHITEDPKIALRLLTKDQRLIQKLQ